MAGVLGLGGGRGDGEKGQDDARSRFPSPISEERARREGRNGHGRGGRAAAMGRASRGGHGLSVQGRAHARVDGSGGACGSAWGKGGGELSGARGRAAEERE